jgi:steroid delta-isomerase-like uncharacterized protein
MSTEQENKALVRRWFDEVISQGNMDTLDAICAECHPQFTVIKGVMDPAPQGMEGLRGLIRLFRAAIPDLRAAIEQQVAEGDLVVTRLRMSGTQQGELFGVPPTGRHFDVAGMSMWEVKGGKLIQEWVNWDGLGMMQQLGVMEQPAAVPVA